MAMAFFTAGISTLGAFGYWNIISATYATEVKKNLLRWLA
jgi:hypothetical protein